VHNKRYSKCGVCVFVETFEYFTYICAGRQLSNNLFPHLPKRHPLCKILFGMKKILVFISLALYIISCNKNDKQISYTKSFVDSEMKSFIFKPGSYWIYQSDSVHGYDSTYISRNEYGFLDIYKGLNQGESFEYYSLISSTNSPNGNSNNTNVIEGKHMLLNPTMYYSRPNGPVLFSFDTIYDWKYYYLSKNKLIDSIKIYNTTYYNVQECKCLSDGDTNIYYTVLNIGIIRKILHQNSNPKKWDLIKWHLLK
jgi:hypothetical protein